MGEESDRDLAGLTQSEVAQRVAEGKTNAYDDPRSRSISSIIKANTLTSFNLVIGALWILMIVARAPFQDSLFGFVIIFNSAIGIISITVTPSAARWGSFAAAAAHVPSGVKVPTWIS